MPMFQKLAWLGAAGACGAVARYGLGAWVHRFAGTGFPWGTLAVNAAGCFAFGALWALAEGRLAWSAEARAIVFIGFLGSFTTFSTFAFETLQFVRDAQWLYAAANFAGQNAVGIAFCFLGMALGKSS